MRINQYNPCTWQFRQAIRGGNVTYRFRCKQWTIELEPDGQTEDGITPVQGYTIYNNHNGDGKKFYQVKDGAYGQPLIEPEPDQKVQAPQELEYEQEGQPIDPNDLYISGVIVQDESPHRFQATIMGRFSLTNGPSPNMSVSDDFTTVEVDGKTYFLITLVDKDKNRFVGSFDAVYGPNKPDKVQIIELAQISFI